MSTEAEQRWIAALERRLEKGHLPGGLDPFLGPTLWRVLGEVNIDFVAKAWLNRIEGWLVVTPDELAFVTRYRNEPMLRLPIDEITGTAVEERRRLRDLLRAPRLVVERRDGEPLEFEMVHYDVAAAAIDEVRKNSRAAMSRLPEPCRPSHVALEAPGDSPAAGAALVGLALTAPPGGFTGGVRRTRLLGTSRLTALVER
jgi:hypothetical protein